MTSIVTMQNLVVLAALFAGGACLVIFFRGAWAAIRIQAPPLPPGVGDTRALELGDLAKLFEAIAKLTDSLAKAGPTIASLVGAMGFFAIAAAMVK